MELGGCPKSIVPGIYRRDVKSFVNQSLRKRALSGANFQHFRTLG
jgi:hypothetical protein